MLKNFYDNEFFFKVRITAVFKFDRSIPSRYQLKLCRSLLTSSTFFIEKLQKFYKLFIRFLDDSNVLTHYSEKTLIHEETMTVASQSSVVKQNLRLH